MTINAHNCNACGMCATVCPKNAIFFTHESGFVTPKIDFDLCIQCGKCVSVCKKDQEPEAIKNVQAFAAWTSDKESRKKSTSGGVGFEIARFLIKNGYRYIGVEMNLHKMIAEAYMTNTVEGAERSRGTKYIPTYMFPAISAIQDNVKTVIIDLPCHIAAYDSYLKRHNMREQFVLVDMFCAGPCNALVLTKELENICNKQQKKMKDIVSVSFRSKERHGWGANFAVEFNDGTNVHYKGNESAFLKLFYTDAFHPETCYQCRYDTTRSSADLRIGDFWGARFKGNAEGVSAVIAFTDCGKKLIEEMRARQAIVTEPADAAEIFKDQLVKPQRRPRQYKKLQYLLRKDCGLKKITEGPLKSVILERRVRSKLKRILHKSKIRLLRTLGEKIKK